MNNIKLDKLQRNLEATQQVLHGAYQRALIQHGMDSTVLCEITEALRHLRNAQQAHETGLTLLPCVKSTAEGIWHIHEIDRVGLCNGIEPPCVFQYETRIPTCPDCIKQYKEKGLI